MKYFILCLAAALSFSGCQRSPEYKADQKYYREDTTYAGRKGSATARADRFGQPKKKVYGLVFMNATPVGGDELGMFCSDELLREIRVSGRAVVPEDLRSADASKDFYSGDKVRLGALVREGKRLGVSILMIGKIKRITYRSKPDEVGVFRQKKSLAAVDLELRMFDIANSKEIIYDEKSADSSSSQLNLFGGDSTDVKSERLELIRMALRNGMHAFAQDAVRALEKISREGRIAKITSGRVYINAGRSTGLNIGDILKVMTPGEDIYDPVTGAYMGRGAGQPKGTLEIVDYLGTDGSVATIHSGGNFVENDAVQLY